MNVVIILPTYNERESIAKLIPFLEKKVFPRIKGHTLSILVADDNSPDGTGGEVIRLSKLWKNIHISAGPRKGFGAAYLRAMRVAITKMSADILIQMDADGQHDPHIIPLFLQKIDQGYDVVIGTRYSGGGSIPQNWPIARKLFSIGANFFIRIAFLEFSVHDWTGGYRALRKEVFLKERKELTAFNGYLFQIAFLQKALRDKFKIAEVPFHFGDRIGGESKLAPFEYILGILFFVILVGVHKQFARHHH